MKLTLGMGLSGCTHALRSTITPAYSQIGGSNASFDASAWNPDSFTLIASLTRAGATNYNSNESQIYVGDTSAENRVSIAVHNDLNRTMRLRMEKNNIESLREDYTLNTRFMAETMKYAIVWDGSILKIYLNGFLLMSDNDFIPPTSVSAICVGQDASGGSITAANSIDFYYFDQALPDSTVRNLSRNTDLLPSITYNASRTGIYADGQSPIAGPSALTNDPVYTNTSLIHMLKLDGSYVPYDDPHMDKTGNLFSSSIYESTTPQTSYIGYVLDELAEDDQEYYVVGAALGGTSMANDWAMYQPGSTDADNVLKNLSMASFYRMLMGMQAGNMAVIVNDQGASDAYNGTSEAVYKDSFIARMNELRAIRGANIPLVIVGLHEWDSDTGVAESTWNNISIWREELANTLVNAEFVDISDIAPRSGDEFHYGASDQPIVAARVSSIISGLI